MAEQRLQWARREACEGRHGSPGVVSDRAFSGAFRKGVGWAFKKPRPATATGPVLSWTCISITWKELPTKKKSKKKSRGRKIDLLPLEKSLFFRRKNADFSARVARFFRKFWRSSGAKERDFSVGLKASEKSEHTLPVQCDHNRAIARVRAMRHGLEGLEIDGFGSYLGHDKEGKNAHTPVTTASPRKSLLSADIYLQSQRRTEKRRGNGRRLLGDVSLYVF